MNPRSFWRLRLLVTCLLIATVGVSLPGDRRSPEETKDCQVAAAPSLPEATAAAISRELTAVPALAAESHCKAVGLCFLILNHRISVQRMVADLAICRETAPLSFWRDIRLQI